MSFNPHQVVYEKVNSDSIILSVAFKSVNGVLTPVFGTTSGTFAEGNDTRIVNALQNYLNLSDVASAQTSLNNLTGSSANFGVATGLTNYGFGNGATVSGQTKTLNIGTNGLSGSSTVINIGSSVSGASTSISLFGSFSSSGSGTFIGLTIKDSSDTTKIASFNLSGISTATTRTYSLPDISATLAHLGNGAQTFAGALTFSNTVIFNSTLTVNATSAVASIIGETNATLIMSRYSADANQPDLRFQKARGDRSTPAAVVTSDVTFTLTWQAYTGSAFTTVGLIRSIITEASPSASALGGRLELRVNPVGSSGGGAGTEIARFEHETGFSLYGANVVIDKNRMLVGRPLTVAALNALTGVAAYTRGFATDAASPTFNATVVGGGAVKVPVWYDGSAWKVG